MQKLLFSLLIVLATFQVFNGVSDNEFIWTDKETVVEPLSLNASPAESLKKIWSISGHKIYMPLTETAWYLVAPFSMSAETKTLSPKIFHQLNLGFHTINAILVLLVLSFFFKSAYPPFIGALLFALHPLQVEPIALISSFSHILGTFFGLISLILFLSYSRTRDSISGWKQKKPVFSFYLATFFFVLSLLSSPAMVIIPLIGLILERQIPKKDSLSVPRKPLIPMIFWGFIALPFALIAISLQHTYAISTQIPFWFRPMIAGDSLAFYINKLFVPLGLGPDYGRSPTFLQNQWWGYLSWLTPVFLALVLTFWRDKSRRWIATGATVLLIGLLPNIGLIAFESQATSTVASRYAYLAMLGPAILIAYIVSIPKKPILSLVAIAGIGLMTFASVKQLKHWQNDTALWKHSLNINPSSPVANRILGDKYRSAKDYDKAQMHYKKVIETNTNDPVVYFQLAEMQRAKGLHEKAIELYKKTLELEPNYSEAYYSLGQSLLAEQNFAEARDQFEKSLELGINNSKSLYFLGRTELTLGNHKEAIKNLEQALALAKDNAEITPNIHAFLGEAYHQLGDQETAKTHLQAALKLAGDQPESHLILGNIYYAQKEFDSARPHYEKAAKAFEDDIQLHKNLGKILIDDQNFGEALSHFETVSKLAPKDPEAMHLLGVANFRLKKFQTSKEYFTKAIQLDSNLADAHYYLGDIARWSGDKDTALASYYKALRIERLHSLSHYRLGNYFMQEKRIDQAIQHYNSALKNSPKDIHIKANLRRAKSMQEEI